MKQLISWDEEEAFVTSSSSSSAAATPGDVAGVGHGHGCAKFSGGGGPGRDTQLSDRVKAAGVYTSSSLSSSICASDRSTANFTYATDANSTRSTSTSTSTSSSDCVSLPPSFSHRDADVTVAENTNLRDKLKTQLKTLLLLYDGCTKHDDVQSVVNQLSKINPYASTRCTESSLFEGDYHTLTAPTFPGRIQPTATATDAIDKKLVQYTLGKLSFNLFQPNKLVCTLRSIRNSVRRDAAREEDESAAAAASPTCSPSTSTIPSKKFTYHLVSDITIHSPDGQDLPATMVNEAWCYENPNQHNRLMVTFTGGTLMPAIETVEDTSKMEVWRQTFDQAYKRADEERSYFGWMFYYFVKILLGLSMTLPGSSNGGADSDSSSSPVSTTRNISYKTRREIANNSFHFDMKRSPTGHFDVLYLDEDMRITKGNRGTVVVVERWSSSSLTVG